ncbi:C6 transcription factor, putative [Paecilomyces variotii No. 5]|uniref:C6 transcription factor, putative n=1 Tax=Byssochlamys spectabilis (strain No. 5 / NBRC 109023) TaxID=1356009 RepID=V5GDU3_BYSSN|nr:C6 transcription factor, putative [Paecilomyces variotii No. 5]
MLNPASDRYIHPGKPLLAQVDDEAQALAEISAASQGTNVIDEYQFPSNLFTDQRFKWIRVLHQAGKYADVLTRIPGLTEQIVSNGVQSVPEEYRTIFPISFGLSQNFPPTILLHGDADELVGFEQSVAVAAALKSLGVEVSLERAEGQTHGFDARQAIDLDENEKVVMALKRGIDDNLGLALRQESLAKRHAPDASRLYRPKDDGLLSASKNILHQKCSSAEWTGNVEGQWRSLGIRGVPLSMPLSNMVSTVQDLIDPEFDISMLEFEREPLYLKPLPSHILSHEIDYLREKDALTIPPIKLRNELLRCYIQWVYNFMPTVDLHEFLQPIIENDPNGNISLLLLQTVMFVGTAFIDLKYLQEFGYSTRHSARKAFFNRVRLLYSLEYEVDRFVVLQALLLMTYWTDYESSPQKDIWHWIGICKTQALSIGLHRDPTRANVDPTTQRLWIRLWWTLYSRDRLIAIGMRRPTQINEGISDVPMLGLNDYDLRPLHPSVIRMLQCPQLENISQQKHLATMFIEKVKLCQCLGRILFAQFSPSNHQFGATDRTTITLVPRQASDAERARCNQKLDTWLNRLPKDAQFIPASPNHIKEGEDVLLLHCAMLRMIYHATSSVLYCPHALAFADKGYLKDITWSTIAQKRIDDAATNITHIIQGLSQLNLVKFLPQSGVTVLLPAVLAHLANLTSTNPEVRNISTYNFNRCMQVLHVLKEIYPAAGIEAARIEVTVKLHYMNSTRSINTSYDNHDFETMDFGQPGCPRPVFRDYPVEEAIRGHNMNIGTQEKLPEIWDEKDFCEITDKNAKHTAEAPSSPPMANYFDAAFLVNSSDEDGQSEAKTWSDPAPDFLSTVVCDGTSRAPNGHSPATSMEYDFGLDFTEDILRDWVFWTSNENVKSSPQKERCLLQNLASSPSHLSTDEKHQSALLISSYNQEQDVPESRNITITGDLDKDLGLL